METTMKENKKLWKIGENPNNGISRWRSIILTEFISMEYIILHIEEKAQLVPQLDLLQACVHKSI